MPQTLGLDIGKTSIGWTLIDSESKAIKRMGVHVYPNGCINFGMGKREISKRTQRRLQRVIRIRYARKRTRKIKLLEALADHGLCPVKTIDLYHWRTTKEFPHGALKSWLDLNPYALRSKALEEKISLFELGRILYHFSQRRGFPLTERSLAATQSALFKGFPKSNRFGISDVQHHLKHQYLGQYLAQLYPLPYQSYRTPKERIRNRYLARDAYNCEAQAIWKFQEQFHPRLTYQLKCQLVGGRVKGKEEKGIVFFQRPLKSQKFRVGRCLYEPSKTRCCVSSLTYQELLAYRWVNTILKDGRPLKAEEREQVVHFYLTHRKFSFQQISSLLADPEAIYNKKSDEMITGSFVNSELSKHHYFGMQWFGFDEKTKEDIWHVLYSFKDKYKLAEYAEQQWGFSVQEARSLSRISIDKRYAPISRKAARNILFFLKRGVSYDLAVIMGGVKNSLSKYWEFISEKDITYITSYIINLYNENPAFGFTQKLQDFLMDYLQLKDFQIAKLYGKSSRIVETSSKSKFEYSKGADDEVYRFNNPPLIAALFQTRKVINAIVEAYGSIDHLRVQLDPTLRVNKHQRYFYKLDGKRIDKNRQRFIGILETLGENMTSENILKLELWEECKKTCPYTGSVIPIERLFIDDFRVVYIQPWNQSINDASLNKTLCCSSIFEAIKDQTPYEYFMETKAYLWPEVVERAGNLFSNTREYPSNYKKFRSFVKRYRRRNILKYHLQDPNFVSQELRCFFTQVCADVAVTPSYSTSYLMDHWRLNELVPEHNWETDLRSSGVRAYVAAVRDEEILTELTQWDKYRISDEKVFPKPSPNFMDEVEYYFNSIIVSYAPQKKVISKRNVYSTKYKKKHLGIAVRGTLHKETIYAKRKAPFENTHSYHIRKTIESFQTQGQIGKIVDPSIKKVVEKAIEQEGGYVNDKVPMNALATVDSCGFKTSKIFLPNTKGGDPVPVNSIRIKENFSGAVALKTNQNRYVNPRNNHHVMVYENIEGELCEQVVTFWEAVARKTRGESLYQLPADAAQYVSCLHCNDLFLIGVENLPDDLQQESRSFLAKHLYRVQKLSSKFYEFRLANNDNLKCVEAPEFIRITNFGERRTGWQSLNPVRVKVNYAGVIQRAKDPTQKIKTIPPMLR